MKKIFVLIHLFIALSLSAQDLINEEELKNALSMIEEARTAENDSLRIALADKAFDTFCSLVYEDDHMNYQFQNINPVSVLTSPDKLFRIFTWGLQLSDGNYKYYGLAEYNVHGDVLTATLYDLSDKTSDPAHADMQAGNWYGAIYYDIVQVGSKKSHTYALAGWDGGDLFVNRKVLEQVSISLEDGGGMRFGGQFVNERNRSCERLIFEFTERAVMSLRYDKKQKMFVADHLSVPSEYNGDPKFSGPDGSFDGYYFEDGRWHYVPDIDIKGARF
ncbi:MAG: hypothetical protein IKS00_04400 [Bacteroidales bacterium]|nr:hypothetical protein [Bacteroidales bacterium]